MVVDELSKPFLAGIGVVSFCFARDWGTYYGKDVGDD